MNENHEIDLNLQYQLSIKDNEKYSGLGIELVDEKIDFRDRRATGYRTPTGRRVLPTGANYDFLQIFESILPKIHRSWDKEFKMDRLLN